MPPQEKSDPYSMISPTTSISPLLTDTELYDMVDKFVGHKISRNGGRVFYAGIEKIGAELFAVTVGVEESEGSTYFIGNDNGAWKVSSYMDDHWCPWLEMSNYDESTKHYLGIEKCRKNGK